MSTRQARGQAAEDRALAHLQSHGLVLAERNFRCRVGEIDWIMRDGDTLVFVEVRSKRSPGFGGAAASVDHRKQRRLVATAEAYLGRLRDRALPPCRFDVVALDGDGEGLRLAWIRDAFDA